MVFHKVVSILGQAQTDITFDAKNYRKPFDTILASFCVSNTGWIVPQIIKPDRFGRTSGFPFFFGKEHHAPSSSSSSTLGNLPIFSYQSKGNVLFELGQGHLFLAIWFSQIRRYNS